MFTEEAHAEDRGTMRNLAANDRRSQRLRLRNWRAYMQSIIDALPRVLKSLIQFRKLDRTLTRRTAAPRLHPISGSIDGIEPRVRAPHAAVEQGGMQYLARH